MNVSPLGLQKSLSNASFILSLSFEMGWPKFRSWKASWFSLLYDEPDKGFKVEGDILTLSIPCEGKSQKLTFSLKESYILKNHKIRNLRITKEGHLYYAIFTIETSLPVEKEIKKNYCS